MGASLEDRWSMRRKRPMRHLALRGQQQGCLQKINQINAAGHGEVSEATMPHSHLLGPDTKPPMFSKAQT